MSETRNYVAKHGAGRPALSLPIRTPGKFIHDDAGDRPKLKHDPSQAWTDQAVRAASDFLGRQGEPR